MHPNASRFDRFVLGISTLVFFGSCFLISDDHYFFRFLRTNSGNLLTIAQVDSLDHDVRRRIETDVSFVPMQVKESIYDGDSVFTGASSSAEITFHDQSKIFLNPQSMVVVHLANKASKIEIAKGTVVGKLRGQSKISLKISNKIVEISGKDAVIQVSKEKAQSKPEISVLSGNAELKLAKAESLFDETLSSNPRNSPSNGPNQQKEPEVSEIKLSKNEHTVLGLDGKAAPVETFPISLISPLAEQTVSLPNGKPISFIWKLPEKTSSYSTIQISKSNTLRQILLSKKLKGESAELGSKLKPGTYFYRVLTKEKNVIKSPIFQFSLIRELPITIPSPTPSMAPPPIPTMSSSPLPIPHRTPTPAPHINKQSSDNITHPEKYAKTAKKQIEQLKPILGTPSHLSPQGTEIISLSEPVIFRWKRTSGAVRYKLILHKKPKTLMGRRLANEPPPQSYKTTQNSIEVSGVELGQYSWEVIAYSKDGQSTKSEAEVDIQMPSLDLTPPMKLNRFELLASASAIALYTYTVYSPASGQSGTVSGTRFSADLKGTYYLNNRWSFALEFKDMATEVQGMIFNLYDLNLACQFRIPLDSRRGNGWSLLPELGPRIRNYYELFPSGFTSSLPNNLLTEGLDIGFTLERRFSERFRMDFRSQYYLPIFLTGTSSGSLITSQNSYANFSSNLDGIYWISSHWGFNLSLQFDLSSLSYQPATSSSSSEQISQMGESLNLGVSYTF